MTKRRKPFLSRQYLRQFLQYAAVVGIYRHVSRFDASDYVRAVLDASYKNETDLYVEITGIPEEEAAGIFDENLDLTMEGFRRSDMPEEMLSRYRDLFGEIAKRVSLYGGGATGRKTDVHRAGDGQVHHTFHRYIRNFSEPGAGIRRRSDDRVTAGAQMPTEEEMQKQVYEIYYEVLKERVDSGMLYGLPGISASG